MLKKLQTMANVCSIMGKAKNACEKVASESQEYLINKALSTAVLPAVNKAASRYAQLTSIVKDSEGFQITAQLNGSQETVTATIKSLQIEPGGVTISLHGISSSIPWVNNILEDFVEGLRIPIPEDARKIVSVLGSFDTVKKALGNK